MTGDKLRDGDVTDETPGGDSGVGFDVNRRDFLRSALAVGGGSALATVGGLAGVPDRVDAESTDLTTGTTGYAERSNRQHAWDDYEESLPRGATKPPNHHLLLHLDYRGSGEPAPEDRLEAERAFRALEHAFGWGHDGLLFTVGYSPAYFDRFRDDDDEVVMPAGLDPENGGLAGKQGLVRPGPLVEAAAAPDEDPSEIAADQYDAVVHIASDRAAYLLHAEEALWGDNPYLYLSSDLDGVFTKPDSFPARRVGFLGPDNFDSMVEFDQVSTGTGENGVYPEAVPDENQYADHPAADGDHPPAELSMGFNPLYENSNPEETNATILEDQRLVDPKPPGLFAQGTIMHVSHLDINAEDWYGNNDLAERRAQMFSPHHDAENTGVTGENLGISNAPGDQPMRDLTADTDVARSAPDDAASEGVVGHVQKLSRARFDLESRVTDAGVDTYRALDRYDAATERADDLPGHDGVQDSEQVVLRRDFDAATGGQAGDHFVALMRFNPYMAYLRAAMNGAAFDTTTVGLDPDGDGLAHDSVIDQVTGEDKAGFVNPDGEGNNDNGILNYLTANRRGNYLVPPLTERALPPASAREVDVTVEETTITRFSWFRGFYDVDRYAVTVPGIDPDAVDNEQFGLYLDVNRFRGASPTSGHYDDAGDPVYLFDPEDVHLAPDAPNGQRVLFRAQDSDGVPVRGYADLGGDTAGATQDSTTDTTEDSTTDSTDDEATPELGDGDGESDDDVVARFSGTLDAGEWATHSHTADEPTAFVVELTADVDQDLYVTFDGSTPTRADADRRSRSVDGTETITIDEGLTSLGLGVRALRGGEYELTVRVKH